MKAVWHRKPSNGPAFWQDKINPANPGDYQSLESRPFTVKPGEITENLSLVCTNRIGPSSAYEADDAWNPLRKPPP